MRNHPCIARTGRQPERAFESVAGYRVFNVEPRRTMSSEGIWLESPKDIATMPDGPART